MIDYEAFDSDRIKSFMARGFKFLVFLVVILTTNFSWAKQDWAYKRFSMVKPGKKLNYPLKIKVSHEILKARIHPKSGTHMLLGMDQVYVSKNLNKKVLIKQDAIPTSKKILNQWVQVNKGHVYHFQKNGTYVAVFAQGYHERGLAEIEKIFVNSKFKRTTYSKYSWLELFASCAYAEIGDPNATRSGNNGPRTQTGVSPNSASSTSAEADDGESLAWCLLNRSASHVGNMADSAWGATKSAAAAVWNDPLGAAQATGSYLYGAGESVVVGAYNAGSAAVNYCREKCLSPDKVWDDAVSAVDKMYALGQQLYTRVAGAIEGFNQLEPAVKYRLMCELGGQMIAEFGVNAVLAFLGGSAMAAPRIAMFLNRMENKIRSGLGVLKLLGSANLSAGEKQQLVTDFMRGQKSESDIAKEIQRANQQRTVAGAANNNDPNTRGSDSQPDSDVTIKGDNGEALALDSSQLKNQAGYPRREVLTTQEQDLAGIVVPSSQKMTTEQTREWYRSQGGTREVGEKLQSLGWSDDLPMTTRNHSEIRYIIENDIEAPKTNWVYHGSSTGIYDSLLENGLDNGRGVESNPGVMMRMDGRATYTNYEHANMFSDGAVRANGGKPMLLRFPTRSPVSKDSLGTTSAPVPANLMEYSLDGGSTWYRLIYTNPNSIPQ